jgi:hypothetical protein
MLFAFIDLFLEVHLHHIFTFMSLAIVLGQSSYIYKLGETGCYSYLISLFVQACEPLVTTIQKGMVLVQPVHPN